MMDLPAAAGNTSDANASAIYIWVVVEIIQAHAASPGKTIPRRYSRQGPKQAGVVRANFQADPDPP